MKGSAENLHQRQTPNQTDFFNGIHPSLPFGTKVRVINLRNNRSVVVRINDRGPFVGGRIIDVTKAAAQKLGFVNAGVTRVRVEVLGQNGLGRTQTACS